MKTIFILFLSFMFSSFLYSQEEKKEVESYKQPHYFKIISENDFFLKRSPSFLQWGDKYYTGGSILELSSSVLKFSKHFLLGKKGSHIQRDYKAQLMQKVYTPADIKASDIQYNDQPYAGVMAVSFMSISKNIESKVRLNATLRLGIVGPTSFAKQSQISIHKMISYQRPNGWDHQIGSGLVIDYYLRLEKRMFNIPNILEITSDVTLALGTMDDYIETGVKGQIGILKDYFGSNNRHKKFNITLVGRLSGRVVAYNGLFLGSLVAFEDSPYTLPESRLERLIPTVEFGGMISIGRFTLTYLETEMYSEFQDAGTNDWGSLQVGYNF